jgi:hypothetical protein
VSNHLIWYFVQDLKFAAQIQVGHIEFGKFWLNVAVLVAQLSGQCNCVARFKRRPLNCDQIGLHNCIARSFGTGDTIMSMIQHPAYFKYQLCPLNRATQLFAIIVARSRNAVQILTIV